MKVAHESKEAIINVIDTQNGFSNIAKCIWVLFNAEIIFNSWVVTHANI